MLRNVLVAGPTKAGKTVFCERLAAEHGFSRIPGDALVLAFQEAFPALGIGHELSGLDPAEAWERCRGRLGPFLVRFSAALAWESPRPYVLDTFHARPEDLKDIDPLVTKVIFLGYPEVDPELKAATTREHQLLRGRRLEGWLAEDDAEVARRFAVFVAMSRELREQCSACRLTFIDTGADFSAGIDAAVALAISTEKLYATEEESP